MHWTSYITLTFPDGKYIVFGFEHNLFIQDLATGEIQQITDDGSPYNQRKV